MPLGRGGVESRRPVHQAKEQRLDVVSVSWLLIYQCPVTRKGVNSREVFLLGHQQPEVTVEAKLSTVNREGRDSLL